MKLTKAHVLKVFKRKYKGELAKMNHNYYLSPAWSKNSLWDAEISNLVEEGLITDKQYESWTEPY